MKALILAAGYATRLYPLTKDKPKPLLLVDDKPIVEHIIRKIEWLNGLDGIFIVTNQKFLEEFQKWQRGFAGAKPIELINDKTTRNSNRLGAIGDMALVIKETLLDDDLLVVAGDNLFDFDLDEFLKFARDRGCAVGVYDVKKRERAKKLGIVVLDDDSRISRFDEKPSQPVSTLASLAIYYFPKNAIPLIDEYSKGANKSDAPGYYIDWLSKRKKVYGYVFTGKWHDIGDIKSYNNAKKEWSKRRKNGN